MTRVNLGKLGLHRWRRAQEGHLKKVKSRISQYRQAQLDPNSTAFTAIGFWGYIFLRDNVSLAERDRLLRRLQEMVDPANNRNIARKIYTKEESYQRDQLAKLPDLILEPEDGYTFSASDSFQSPWFVKKIDPKESRHVGTCHLDGIVVFEGAHVKSGPSWLKAELLDITPTVVYYTGRPVPKYMDGRVLEEVFNAQRT